jgi:hypothetical protein
MPLYESDFTQFMRGWMQQHPEQQEEQRKGRALWWDKPQNAESTERQTASRVPQKAYYYQNDVS